MNISDYFTEKEKAAMIAAIQEAEMDTSGEIRIHIEKHTSKTALDRAAQVFANLKMHKTALRNGILLYIAMDDRKLAILGDAGINAKVDPGFWDKIINDLISSFRQGNTCPGICRAVKAVGKELKAFFPHAKDDINELSDDISFKD